MIISASYKTDIPAFYGDWFLNRVNAGFCKMVNPYNRKIYRVSLNREDVDGFIFWTKNIGPFLDKLEDIRQRGFPFIVQYTIHAYPRELESSVIDVNRSIKYMGKITEKYGSKVVVWRYDPIVFSSLTPISYHLENFENIAMKLDGLTDEVVISFAQIYRKTKVNMDLASRKMHFSWEDPADEIKFNLASNLAEIARAHNMQLTMCSQRRFLAPGIKEARCVDAHRLSDVAGYRIRAKLKGNRPECGCYESIDIGDYDTCPHGCIYCYAVTNRKFAQIRYKAHDSNCEFLYKPDDINTSIKETCKTESKQHQKTLFDDL